MFSISKSPDVRATPPPISFIYLFNFQKEKLLRGKSSAPQIVQHAMFSLAHFLHDLMLFVTLLLSPPSSRARNQLPLVKN